MTPPLALDSGVFLACASLALKLSTLTLQDGLYVRARPGWGAWLRDGAIGGLSHLALLAVLASALTLALGAGRPARRAAVGIHLGVLALAYLDLVYARYSGLHFSYAQLDLVGEGGAGLTTLLHSMRAGDLAYLLDLPLLLAFWGGRPQPPAWPLSSTALRRALASGGLALAAGAAYLGHVCPGPDLLARPYNRRFTPPTLWFLNAFFYLLPRAHHPLPPAPPPGLPRAVPVPGPGPGPRPDLLCIQIESLSGGALAWDLAGGPVMPYLRELAATGRYYPQGVSTKEMGMSFDADLAVLSGFHPPPSSNPYAYAFPAPPYLPHLLVDAGYAVAAYDNYVPEFFHQDVNYSRLGIPALRSIRDRSWSTRIRKVSVNCPGDLEFFAWVDAELAALPSPRFALVKNTTTHGPWLGLEAEPELTRVLGDRFAGAGELAGYAASLAYLDLALARLLEPRRAALAAGSLVVAIYGDHGSGLALPGPPLPGLDADAERRKHVPILFLGLPGPPSVETAPASIQDIPATLARVAGLAYPPGTLGGRDLLAPAPLPPLVTPEGAWDSAGWRPLAPPDQALLAWGYGKLGAPR